MNTVAKRVREYYLRGFVPRAPPSGEMMKRWYAGGQEVDDALRERFAGDVRAAAAGEYDALNATAEGALANVILLDQFTRNIFRGTPEQFAYDAKALALAKDAVDRGLDRQLDAVERMFFYLPFEHAESREEQQRSVDLFTELHENAPEEQRQFCKNLLDYAVQHQEPIEKFGRFPHRNAVLGRESTAEELEHLKAAGGFSNVDGKK